MAPSPHAPYGDVPKDAPTRPDLDPGAHLKVPPTPKPAPPEYKPREMGNIGQNGFTPEQVAEYHRTFTTRGWNVSESAWFSFVRIPEFFHTANISRGTGPVRELQKRMDLEKAIGALKNDFPGVSRTFPGITLEDYVDQAEIAAFIVLHEGKIVYERYPRMRPEDKHIYWSISKTTVGLMVGLLEAEGLVNVHKSIAFYIPRLRGTDWEDSTVLDCLHMASGMGGREHDDHEDGRLEGNYCATFGIMNAKHTRSHDTLEFIANLRRQKPAGAAYEYSCVDTQVLDWLVQCVTRKPFNEAFSERVWRRIGAEADAHVLQGPLGECWSPAAVCSTLRDLARYGTLFTRDSWSAVSKERIVPQSFLDKVKTPWRPQILDRGWLGYYGSRNMFGEEGRKDISHCSYQIDLVWKDGAFVKTGANDQGLFVHPDLNLVVAYFGAHNLSSTPTQTWGRAIADSGLFGRSRSTL
ncbi:beta-lactamase/transpeptidase-like protein [Hyaloraphidium curvatum]|nr:beta-lactamase/transpeptidase-like protein [Hyaloraphidium curvatum]